jgi:hypothetical protein
MKELAKSPLISLAYEMPSFLLEPGSHLMTCPEVVEYQTEPACSQYDNCHNQLTYNADRLFKDVQYTPDSADNTC